MAQAASPRLAVPVTDLAAQVHFFAEQLGFTLVEHHAEADIAVVDPGGYPVLLAGPHAGDLKKHLAEVHEVARPGAVLHFYSPDLDATLAAVTRRGAAARLVETTWGDRTVQVSAPDGYTVSFWTEIQRSREEVLELYARGPAELDKALAGLTEADLDLARAPGKWTIRQIVHHMVDSDATVLARGKMALAEPGRTYRANPYSPDRWAEALDYAGRPIAPAVALFRAIREHMTQLLNHLPDAWERYTQNERGDRMAVVQLIGMLAAHAMGHIDQIHETRRVHGR